MKLFLKLLFIESLVGMLPTSCAVDKITEEVVSHPDYIGFSSTTTRASGVDLSTMQNDVSGFRVYATGGSYPLDWYSDVDHNRIDGTNNYRYSFNQWVFDNPVKWSSAASNYPMSFYAYYPLLPAGLSVTGNFVSGVELTGDYTVQGVGSQVDLLAAKATAASKPASGKLTLTFNHILSKINFGIIAGTGTAPVIQSLQVVNVGDKRTYDFAGANWVSTPQAVTGNASYYYFGAPGGAVIATFTPPVRDESTANPISTGIHNKHLMLMPQTSASWKPQSGTAPVATSGGYISMTYRMSTGNGTNGIGNPREVGFADAKQHPDYATSGGGITGPLYVKAGFPLPATAGNFTWEKGRSYLYNIVLGAHGSCNGYILDENYYDEKGERTNLKLVEVGNENKKIGDKLQDGVIHVILDVDNWDNQVGGDITPGTITVTPSYVLLKSGAQAPAPQNLHVNCTKHDGTHNPFAQWTLRVPDTQPWLRISLSPTDNFANAKTTLSDTGSKTIYIYASANAADTVRGVNFFLNEEKAGVIYQSFKYTTLPNINPEPATGFCPYVGAFWRANQTGERVIKIDAGSNGYWKATVVWLDPRWDDGYGIVLSAKASADPKIYTANPNDAENYDVDNDSITVRGEVTASNKYITLRIGLKSKYTPTTNFPARYALVLISYGNYSKNQLLYLRQGEEADFLMKNGDSFASGSDITARTAAKRFSPYNLTAAKLDAEVDRQDAVTKVNSSKFTEYPTQSGAFFQWAAPYLSTDPTPGRKRWAWNPYTLQPTGNTWDVGTISFWNSSKDGQETCPPGYHRPNDGLTDRSESSDNISNSEMRHSLLQKPIKGANITNSKINSVWGYYADGFFDRRVITVNSSPIPTLSTVASNTNEIAHIGRLFFNPNDDSDHYNASIFFPAGGYRDETAGHVNSLGIAGEYWTSSAYDSKLAIRLVLNGQTSVGLVRGEKPSGFLIRCVKD
jgi:hypothetical protein